jgi:Secretion system C-terminal sorting domain
VEGKKEKKGYLVQQRFLIKHLEKNMKAKMVLCLFISVLMAGLTSRSEARVTLHPQRVLRSALPVIPASDDTMHITGGTLAGGENAGALEEAINGDTLADGSRANPNRVYALNEGQAYFQVAPIDVNDPTGTLTIVGVSSSFGTTKPVIVISPTGGQDVVINGGGVNVVYGSIKLVNIHYQTQQLDGTIENELFYCGTANNLPQKLTIDNCLFEFSNIDLFDCTNETGAIGGWPYGASFYITNSYFRNMFYAGQWWGSRIFQCKHPIDTLWIENNTVTTGGLTFLQQNELTDFCYINHNTIVNNKKYWLLSPYHKDFFVTNNIFINQNWVGEDTNVTNSGQDPDKQFMSTINVDTNNTTNGLVVNTRYETVAGDDSSNFSSLLNLNNMDIYISNNVNYYDPLLLNDYYNTTPGTIDSTAYPLSYLTWSYVGPWQVKNIPGEWMNARTQALFNNYSPAKGGNFIEEHTTTANPNTTTPGIADASVVTAMAGWNQNQWGDPKFATAPDIDHSKYIYGDYDPTTIPGKGTEDGSGITKFTDLTENFSQTTVMSALDGLPVGSLIWNDALNSNYSSSDDWAKVKAGFVAAGGTLGVQEIGAAVPHTFNLSQNYPNPFNPTTQINFSVPQNNGQVVTLKVYNLLGQEVATLFSGTKAAGNYSVSFNASKLSSGVYFYRLSSDNFSVTKKMVLMK